ncbi:Peptidoglycan/LPS O-acetylase OafA/YrhL, contains acyltransferase and SGNH-hydrolase domains [Rhodospira trueperi]|uniref:Peptidoglycan/LPS O-acetylase OafA/YrhL, contains acyltransferase and SGNH-hydrolase domains n=2 Tax=Rhodospira trueperi TaxID=69960 RepID=A0A1G7AXD2_9PROT|nr:Peptidoglycan/LPS O-acetylase OafA/YrhL, contains acyltransferase and SGNH-hydrolase domains [Rhodospira trueperi]
MMGKARLDMRSDYIPALDGLRAIAVSIVALYHAFPDFMPGGFLGVDVFFVISGYLITGLIHAEIQRNTFDVRAFFVRRMRRLGPALVTVSAVVLTFGFVALDADSLVDLAQAMAAALGLSANWYFFFTEDYFNPVRDSNLLVHYWSLSVEEQFYLVWPFLLLLPLRRAGLATVVAGVGLASFAFAGWSGATEETPGAFFSTPLRVWELAAGACLALTARPVVLRSALSMPWVYIGTLAAGLGLILGSSVLVSGQTGIPGPAAVPAVVGALLVILTVEHPAPGRAGRHLGLSSGPVVYVGRLSYSWYLWHWPVLVAARQAFVDINELETILLLLVSLGLASLSYHWIEMPVRKRRVLGRPRDLMLAMGFAVALLLCAIAVAVLGKGLPGRISPQIQTVLAVEADQRRDGMRCGSLADLSRTLPIPDSVLGSHADVTACALGDPSAQRVSFVLWGDSHLGAIQPAAGIAASEAGSLGLSFAMGACPPLFGTAWSALSAEAAQACADRNVAVAEVIRLLHPPCVTLVAHWDTYALRPTGWFGQLRPGKLKAVGRSEPPDRLFEAALKDTVSQLAETTRLRILVDVPTHDIDVPQSLALDLRFPWLPGQSWMTRSRQEERRATYMPVFREATQRWGGTLIDPLDAFCPEETCLAAIDGVPAFHDSSHLSAAGADYLLARHPELVAACPGAAEE